MSAAQEKNKANFKKAIAYQKKTGCTLKEAFAHIKGSSVAKNKVGSYKVVEVNDKPSTPANKIVQVKRRTNGTFKSFNKLGSFFDVSVIKDLDALKKQYYKLSKKYHPDAGGTTSQFQELQKEYEKHFNTILKGGSLNTEQQQNEIVIDKAIRDIIDNLINLENITVEVIGKWLWIGGNTYPIRSILKTQGLTFIKKNGVPFWVYKGVESSGRGNMSLDEIKAKYGVSKFDIPQTKKINGVVKFNRTKLKNSLLKLKKALDKRPI